MKSKNTPIQKYLKWAIICIAGLFGLVWAAWLVAIPADLIKDRAILEMEKAGLKAEFRGFSKGLLFSIKAESLTLSSETKEYATFEDLIVSLNITSLLALRPTVIYSGTLGDGELEGNAWMRGEQYALNLKATDIDLAKVGLDRILTGLRAKGVAEISLELESGTGSLRFTASELNFSPYKYMGFALPLDLARTLRAAVTLDTDTVTVDSVSLDGDGIYARLLGTLARRRADLTLVLTPEPELEQSLPLFALLKKYEVTAGRYESPIRRSF